jgi:hypothetical protein
VTELPTFNGKLEPLQKEVGGFVQLVELDGRTELWVNEEGKLNNLPFNLTATRVWESVFGPTDLIVGTAIIVVKGTKPTKVGAKVLKILNLS